MEVRLINCAGPQRLPSAGQQYVPSRASQYLDTRAADLNNGEDRQTPYWQLIKNHKGAILLVALSCALGGFLFTLLQPRIYQAHTSIEIQGLNENFLNMRDVDLTAGENNPDTYLQTQLKIMQAESLLERVIDKTSSQRDLQALYSNDGLSRWRRILHLGPPTQLSREEILARASKQLGVHLSANTRLIEVTYDSPDPKYAAEFANTLVGEYIEQNLEARWTGARKTSDFLTRQLDDLKLKLATSENALQDSALQAGLLLTGDQDKESVAEQKLRELQEELTKAEAERVARQSRYELVASSPAESLTEVLDDNLLRDLQQKLVEMRRQLAELSAAYTPAHYKVQRLQIQIASVEAAFQKQRNNILGQIRNEFQAAWRREALIRSDYSNQLKLVSAQSVKAVHYHILKREVDTNRQLYEALLQKVKEAGIVSAMRATNIRVVDPAKPPSLPHQPNAVFNIGIGFLSGMFLGLALVVMRQRWNGQCIQEPGDTPRYLSVPELGVIPWAAVSDKSWLPHLRPWRILEPDGTAEQESGRECVELVAWHQKPSVIAESFRAILTSILFSGHDGTHPEVIVITSAEPREGKTVVASNLAIALAEIRQRVLIIDSDMRNPRLHEIFGFPNSWGLSDLLRETQPLSQIPLAGLARATEVPGLYVLPSGPSTVTTMSLLCSTRMRDLLARVRQEFEMVLIDSPPVLMFPDARVLGRAADGVVLVVRAGDTLWDAAWAARQRLLEDGVLLLGTVLNSWDPQKSGRDSYEKYGYYHQHDVQAHPTR